MVALATHSLFLLQIILFTFCAGNELFFIALFLLTESAGPTGKWRNLHVTLYLISSLSLSLVVLIYGYNRGLFEILAFITFPISLMKNLINILQMFYAAKNIASHDVARRASASQ